MQLARQNPELIQQSRAVPSQNDLRQMILNFQGTLRTQNKHLSTSNNNFL